MKVLKKILTLGLLLTSVVSQAEMFSEEEYQKIEDSFIDYARKNGDDVYPFYIENYSAITDEERLYLEKESEKSPEEIQHLISFILKGEANNLHYVINFHNNITAWVMSDQLKGQKFIDNECTYLKLISTNEDCITIQPLIRTNIKEVLTYNNIVVNEEYFADFFYVHELSHLIPQQRTLPNDIDVTRIWVDDVNAHYREIYSDLFAAIYLHNIVGYNLKEMNNIVTFRNFNLNANDDLTHYSVPYLKEMLKNEKWKTLSSFESINDLIEEVYVKVNKDIVVSKKRFKHIQAQNFQWCNNVNFSPFKIRETLDKVVYHCKKMKNN